MAYYLASPLSSLMILLQAIADNIAILNYTCNFELW